MKIQITQEHIELGRLNKKNKNQPCMSCPIALALEDVIDLSSVTATVGQDVVSYCLKGGASLPEVQSSDRLLPLPFEARTFIRRFDNNVEVSPFEFELGELI